MANSIIEIFNGGEHIPNKTNQLKFVKIDWDDHAKGIINIAKNLEPKFQITKYNIMILNIFLHYFTGSSKFITQMEKFTGVQGSLNKGIMLVGGVGTGKSLLFKIFHRYTRDVLGMNGFQSFTAMEITDTVNVSGVGYLEIFNQNMVDRTAKPIRCYIDDIGSKNETVKHFGTDLSVIEQLLFMRYNIFERHGILTHATSNKFPMDMVDLYDMRVIDRMREMFNIISLEGESFRR